MALDSLPVYYVTLVHWQRSCNTQIW